LRHGIFCELGRGCVDFTKVLQWLEDQSYDVNALWNRTYCPAWERRKIAHCATGSICAQLNMISRNGCEGESD